MGKSDQPDRNVIQLSENHGESDFFASIELAAQEAGLAPSAWIKFMLKSLFQKANLYPKLLTNSYHWVCVPSDGAASVMIRDELVIRHVSPSNCFVHGWFIPFPSDTSQTALTDLKVTTSLSCNLLSRVKIKNGLYRILVHDEDVLNFVKSGLRASTECSFKVGRELLFPATEPSGEYSVITSFPTKELVVEVVLPLLPQMMNKRFERQVLIHAHMDLPDGRLSSLLNEQKGVVLKFVYSDDDVVITAKVPDPEPGKLYTVSWPRYES